MKIKPVLMISIILLIGFVIGFLVSGQMSTRRHRKFIEQRTQEGFINRFYEMLELDETQKTKIGPLIDDIANKNQELTKSYRQEIRVLWDSLDKKMKPFLSEEQIEKLESMPTRRGGRGQNPRGGDRDRAPDNKTNNQKE